jgi:hypothetical protein
MEVVESRAALLSNFEVLQLLNERMESQKQKQKEYPNSEYAENSRTIQFEVNPHCIGPINWQTANHLTIDQNSVRKISM